MQNKQGQEQIQYITGKIGTEHVARYRYTYTHSDGRTFSTFSRTIEKCRAKKDAWLKGEFPLSNKNIIFA